MYKNSPDQRVMCSNELNIKRAFIYLFLTLLFSGCNTVQNITDNPSKYTDYAKGQLYKIQKPMFLFKLQKSDREEIPRLANLGFGGTSDNLFDFYQNDLKAPQVVGLLLPGTHVKICKIEINNGFAIGSYVHVYALINEGELMGALVDLSLISESNSQEINLFVNPDQLVLVK